MIVIVTVIIKRRHKMANELIIITGPRGVGKSLLAATYLPPGKVNRVYVHDSENSMNRVLVGQEKSGYKFGRYVDLKAQFSGLPGEDDLLDRINAGQLPWVSERAKSNLVNYYQYILSDIAENLTPGKYDVYIHDTLEKFEAGMAAWVESNKKLAGVTSTAYGKLWSEGVYVLYENLLTSLYNRGVKTVILCSHLKMPWHDKRPVIGKVIPSGKKILYRLSSLMLWLVNDRRNSDGAPAGLVLKERMGDLAVVDGKWQIRRMLPERIPHCEWEDIRRYLREGADFDNPAPGETISQAEKAMISELLTDEQMKLMILAAEQDLAEARQQSVLTGNGGSFTVPVSVMSVKEEAVNGNDTLNPFEKTVKELIAEGKSEMEIAQAIDKPLPIVKALVRRLS